MNINKEIVKKCIKTFWVSVIFFAVEFGIICFYRRYVSGLSDEQRNQFDLTFRIRYRYGLMILYGIVGYIIVKFLSFLKMFRYRFLSGVFIVVLMFINGANIIICEAHVISCSVITFITALAIDSFLISKNKNAEKDLIIAQAVVNSTLGVLANWFIVYGIYRIGWDINRNGYNFIADKYNISTIIIDLLLFLFVFLGIIAMDVFLYDQVKKNNWLRNTTYGIFFILNAYFVYLTLYSIVWTFPGILGAFFVFALLALYTLIFLIRTIYKIIKKHK